MSNERAAARNSQSGFTLLELMVVLAIIVVLAASLVPSFHNHMQAARVAATMADLRCIDSAMTNYAFTHPDSPIPPNIASYADLAAVSSSNGCWMPPEGDPDNPGPPWKFYRRLCTVVISGRITYIPCDLLTPQPQGYELYVQVKNVSPDYRGAVVGVSSDRGIHAYTLLQAQQMLGTN